MRFHVIDAEYDGQRVWRIVGPSNEYVGREAYSTRDEAASECQKFNDEHAALEQAVKDNEIMGSLSSMKGANIPSGTVSPIFGCPPRI